MRLGLALIVSAAFDPSRHEVGRNPAAQQTLPY
jgi:hypothetical protein